MNGFLAFYSSIDTHSIFMRTQQYIHQRCRAFFRYSISRIDFLRNTVFSPSLRLQLPSMVQFEFNRLSRNSWQFLRDVPRMIFFKLFCLCNNVFAASFSILPNGSICNSVKFGRSFLIIVINCINSASYNRNAMFNTFRVLCRAINSIHE